MSEVILADELQVGDVFRRHGILRDDVHGGLHQLRRVVDKRTANYAHTYTVLNTESVDGRGTPGELDIKFDVCVERVTMRTHLDDVVQALTNMQPGQQLTVWKRPDGGFYL